jgi:hypothetical protein
MRVQVLSLGGALGSRMAIEATRMLKHPTSLDEDCTGAFSLIAGRGERLW